MSYEDLVGRKLGPYKIVEFLDSGGMAEIYKGYHPGLDRYVAVKIVGRHLDTDPVFNARFRREAKAIAQLRHPNIVQVYDFGETGGGHYMVMEFIEGINLADLLYEVRSGQRTLEPDDITFVVRQVASALDHAHSHGVIHRDVKPGNIMITPSGQAILTDFGLAMLLNRGAEDESGGTAFGTPEYMAPEQVSDSRAASAASDIYSLGVIAYELVTGELPFEADNAVDMALRHLNDTAPDPRFLKPDLPDSVADVILRTLAKNPKERFRSAMQMANALERAWTMTTGDTTTQQAVPLAEAPVEASAPQRRRPAAERMPVVKRGPSKAEERRRKREARAEYQQRVKVQKAEDRRERKVAKRLERQARREARAEQARERRRHFVGRWARTLVVLLVVTLVLVAGALVLQSMGILSVSLSLPTLATETGTPLIVATASPTPLPPTVTPTSTDTPVPTATPLQAAEATPIPPIEYVQLDVGTQAFRIHDGGVMMFVPAGPFLMGTNDPRRNLSEQPQHTVTLSDYWIDRTEVTNAQYQLCVDDGLCQPPIDQTYFNKPEYADYPVTQVQYAAAVAYCLWLAGQTNQVIGLPTEAQWEKAASWDPFEQVARLYPWGNEPPTPERLRFVESLTGRPAAPVGTHPAGASAYGVQDMAGNVWEWTADWFDPEYYQRTGVALDPTGPMSGTGRVTRGGGWSHEGRYALSSLRNPAPPSAYGPDLGFRCAMSAERPPVNSGIVLSPIDASDALIALLEAAGDDPANDGPTLDEWITALSAIRTTLRNGDNAAALVLIEDRLPRLVEQRDFGFFTSRLALHLDYALRWMQEQLRPEP